MTVLGGVLAMLAGLLRDLTQLAASPSGLTALAGAVLAGAMFAAVLALLISVASLSRTTAALPMIRRASALREKSWRAAFLRGPTMQSALVPYGVMVDTFETACTWSRFEALDREVRAALERAMAPFGGPGGRPLPVAIPRTSRPPPALIPS